MWTVMDSSPSNLPLILSLAGKIPIVGGGRQWWELCPPSTGFER